KAKLFFSFTRIQIPEVLCHLDRCRLYWRCSVVVSIDRVHRFGAPHSDLSRKKNHRSADFSYSFQSFKEFSERPVPSAQQVTLAVFAFFHRRNKSLCGVADVDEIESPRRYGRNLSA